MISTLFSTVCHYQTHLGHVFLLHFRARVRGVEQMRSYAYLPPPLQNHPSEPPSIKPTLVRILPSPSRGPREQLSLSVEGFAISLREAGGGRLNFRFVGRGTSNSPLAQFSHFPRSGTSGFSDFGGSTKSQWCRRGRTFFARLFFLGCPVVFVGIGTGNLVPCLIFGGYRHPKG